MSSHLNVPTDPPPSAVYHPALAPEQIPLHRNPAPLPTSLRPRTAAGVIAIVQGRGNRDPTRPSGLCQKDGDSAWR